MQKAVKIITIAALCALCGIFALWLFSGGGSTLWGVASAALFTALFGLCGVNFLPTLFGEFSLAPRLPQDSLGPRSLRRSRRHPWAQIIACVLLSRLLIFILAYAITTSAQGYSGGLLDTLRATWIRSDANSYLGIAERWYVTEGDPRFHIVFFPLYPIVVRLFTFIIGNGFAAALTVSSLCAALSGCLAYELFALDTDRAGALAATRYLFLLPAAFFLNAPMTESLFLLLSLAALLLARKRRFLFACIFAALAGFTRSVGALLLLPIAIELAVWICEAKRNNEPGLTKRAVLRGLCLFIVPLGLCGYLLINYLVTGDALKFMEYQREHWSQGFGWFFNTAGYQAEYAINAAASGDTHLLWGLFMPNLVFCFASLAVMAAAAKRLRASYTAYYLGYYFIAMGVTWLLSGPRYLTVMFPLALALSLLTKRRGWDIIISVFLLLLQIGYLAMFVLGWPVY